MEPKGGWVIEHLVGEKRTQSDKIETAKYAVQHVTMESLSGKAKQETVVCSFNSIMKALISLSV